jgi:cell division septation protein DedD
MKIRILFFIFTAMILFNSSSPWEGAAAVAPEGELPVSGFFVATNSFPRNTVVDITNIETGRSTRVIVANTINSPGLLAVVSREAADLIGMRSGSISRIRMISPSDPIAYQRFVEGLAANIPQFDSGNVIRSEEELLAEVYQDDSFVQVAVTPEPEAPAPSGRSHFTGPSYIMEPEWGGTARLEIVNVPRFTEQPVGPFDVEQPVQIEISPAPWEVTQVIEEEPEYIVEAEPEVEEPVYIVEAEPEVEEPVYIVEAEPEVEEPVYIVEAEPEVEEPEYIVEAEIIKDVSDRINESALAEIVKDVDDFIVEQPRDDIIKDVSSFVFEQPAEVAVVEEIEEEPIQELVQEPATQTEYDLVRADERVPEPGIYGIDPNDIIPSVAAVVPTPEPPAERPAPPVVSEPAADVRFSIPSITQLARGQFYVQIAALPSAALVENVIGQINLNYNPVVFVSGDNLYRILIGPLNQGESAAILARFRSIGYRDAFVRQGV